MDQNIALSVGLWVDPFVQPGTGSQADCRNQRFQKLLPSIRLPRSGRTSRSVHSLGTSERPPLGKIRIRCNLSRKRHCPKTRFFPSNGYCCGSTAGPAQPSFPVSIEEKDSMRSRGALARFLARCCSSGRLCSRCCAVSFLAAISLTQCDSRWVGLHQRDVFPPSSLTRRLEWSGGRYLVSIAHERGQNRVWRSHHRHAPEDQSAHGSSPQES